MTDWSTLKKLIWLRIIKGGGSALRTVTGALIHVTNALALPAKALSVNVEPTQDLHGYDSPWPAGGGVNLLDPAKCSAVDPSAAYGLTVTHDQATAIWTISGTPTSQSASLAFNFCTYSDFSLSGKGYQVQDFPISGTPIKNFYGFRNEAENKIAIIIDTVANPTVNMTFKVSVAATSQTAWSPYSNICPISGRTSATVTRTGANVWDEQWELGGIAGGTGLPFSATDRIRSKNFCPCKGNTAYYLKNTTNATALIVWWYDANQTFISSGGTDLGQSKVETSPSNARYFKISSYGGNYASYDDDFSVNYPSTDHDYHSYQGNTYTVQLSDTVYGGTLDVTGGKMVVDRAMVDLGTMNWFYNKAYAFFTSSSLANRAIGVTNLKSDLFKTTAGSWSGTPLQNAIWGNGSNATIYVQIPPYDNVADFVQLVAGHQLVYELATPIEITLTPTQIDMLLGENNLWADAGDSTLTYYAEGEASTSEALGILLGGTYNNPGGADDVSDDEALGILLGGS